MAERYGFFNAVKTPQGYYDRTYSSEDYCDNLAVIISNGVLRSTDDDLKPVANGLAVNINPGRAWCKGHWYHNDALFTFTDIAVPTGYDRADRIVLRLDNNLNNRNMKLIYVEGVPAIEPAKPELVRDENIYDLCIADVYVAANASEVIVYDTRGDANVCGWIYSTSGDDSFFTTLEDNFNEWFIGVKETLTTSTVEVEYQQHTVLQSAGKTVEIVIPQYNSEIEQRITVYINGARAVPGEDYTITGSIISFVNELIAGTEVDIVLVVARDGTGIPDAMDEITDLQNRINSLENGLIDDTYNYVCKGVDDNVNISNIITTYLNGGEDYGTLTIHVYGTCGITTPVGGDGTSVNPYRWFNAGLGGTTNRRVILDFGSCSQLTIPVAAETSNIVFYGLHANIRNASVVANNNEATITMFSTPANTKVKAENCRFWITAASGYIARNGIFRDCRVSLTIRNNNAYCFVPQSASLVRLINGEYYAYASTGYTSAVVFVDTAYTNAVVNTYSISCPKVDRSGFVQSYAIKTNTNNATCSFTDTITTLTIDASGMNIRGTIALDKADV